VSERSSRSTPAGTYGRTAPGQSETKLTRLTSLHEVDRVTAALPALLRVDVSNLAASGSPLRQKSAPIATIDAGIRELVGELRRVLASIPYGGGLAAVQIGVPFQLAIVNAARTPQSEIILINPRVLSLSGRVTSRREGCLSLPDHAAPVRRRNKIVVETLTLDGDATAVARRGFEATVIQHELDHMDGLFYWDRLDHGTVPTVIDAAGEDAAIGRSPGSDSENLEPERARR
jgi:peptide deformylase